MGGWYPTVGAVIVGSQGHGDLRLDEVLGSGAFGIVFRASLVTGNGSVAVKFLHAGVLPDPHERQALFNEVLAAKSVQHENVIRVLAANFNADDYPPYVVTEFAEGGTLQHRLNEAAAAKAMIPLNLVAGWSRQLAAALKAINARVLHRDLKPDNILFTDATLKVADFGLAKLVGAATRSVTFKGGQHVLYMAPEAWDGRRNDIQIDMYSAGIVMFQIGTLEYPYVVPTNTADFDAFRRMHLLQSPKNPRTTRPELPQRFAEVIDRLLAKRPENRYRTWDDVTASVARAFEGDTESGSPSPAVVSKLVEEAHQRHREESERRLAAEARERQRGEEAEIDRVQEREIYDQFARVVADFNDQTEGPKASIAETGQGQYRINLPFAESGTLSFFRVEPPLRIDHRTVRFAARVADGKGCGFNLLLMREQNEVYGRWTVCRVRVNPLSHRVHRHCEYFGFDANEVVEIERGHHAMHVFVPEFSAEVLARA